MKKNQLVSVIVITYNSSKTVIDTLNSIKSQTYPEIEIVVSDDGSKDCTLNLVKEWFKNNNSNGIVVSSNKNTGVTANVNRGVKASNSNLFKIIAGDDVLFKDAIEKFYNFYLDDSSVIWQSKVHCFGVSCKISEKIEKEMINETFFTLTNKEQYKLLSIKNYISAPAVGLLSKELILKNDCYDESIPMIEDYPFNLKVSKNGYSFRLIDEKLVGYRINENSATNLLSKRYCKSMSKFFFKTRFLALLENKCYGESIKQLFIYIFFIFGLSVSKEKNKFKFRRIY